MILLSLELLKDYSIDFETENFFCLQSRYIFKSTSMELLLEEMLSKGYSMILYIDSSFKPKFLFQKIKK